MSLLIGFFTVLLILVSLFMVLIILMQRPRSDSGLGAALGGGGAADAAFGTETANVLSRGTIYCAIFFFLASFGLYLGQMYLNHSGVDRTRALPELRAVGEPAGMAPVVTGEAATETATEETSSEPQAAAEESQPTAGETSADAAPEAPVAPAETETEAVVPTADPAP